MRNIFLFALLVLLSVGVFAATSGSTVDPSDIGVGARPLGMGKAYVGQSDDASGIFINPAGLARADSIKLTSMSGQVLQDINYVVVGGAVPSELGTFGIGYISAGVPSIPVTTITGSGTSTAVVPTGTTNYTAAVTTLSYSNELSKLPLMSDFKDMTFGLNLKYFQQDFQGGGSALKDGTGTGFDMDLGLQYHQSKPLTIGLSVLNFLPASAGGKFTWATGAEENIPAVAKVGGTAKLFGTDSYYGGKQNVFVGLDMDSYPTENRPSVFHVGAEWWPISVLALRMGLDQKPKGTDSGTGIDNNYTAGIGLKYHGFTFDYCYHQFSDLTDNVTHFFSIGYVGPDEDEKPAEKPANIIPVIVPKVSLKSFNDVTENYWAKSPIQFMATLGVMNGFSDGLFRPDEQVSRAELASMLVKLRDLEVNEATSDPYPDVQKEYWAAKYIKAVSYMDLMKNYPDGTFKPDKKVTRVEAAVILSRFTDAPQPASLAKDPFVDVPRSHWAAKYISAAQSYGLLDYLIGKKFEPNRELTRAEVAEILSKTSYGKDRIRDYLKTGI